MAKKRINREKNFENGTVTFTVIETGQSLVCDLSKVPQAIQNHLLVHAINAKVGDSAADPNTDALEAMQKTWEQLCAGEWNARGTGEGTAKTTMLAEALARVSGKDLDAVNEKLSGMSDEEKKDLRDHPAVKAAMAEIKLERQKAAAKKAKDGAKGAELNF